MSLTLSKRKKFRDTQSFVTFRFHSEGRLPCTNCIPCVRFNNTGGSRDTVLVRLNTGGSRDTVLV